MSGPADPGQTAADAMIPMRDGCVPTNRADDVLEMVEELAAAGMPVARAFGAAEMLGVVMREDLDRGSDGPGETRVEDLPWQPVIEVTPDTPLDSIAHEANPVRIVVDDAGALLGILDTAR